MDKFWKFHKIVLLSFEMDAGVEKNELYRRFRVLIEIFETKNKKYGQSCQ